MKPKCRHKINKKQTWNVPGADCSPKPTYKGTFDRVDWKFTDLTLSASIRKFICNVLSTSNNKLISVPKEDFNELHSAQMHLENKNLNLLSFPRCVYLSGNRVQFRRATPPGIHCTRAFSNYSVNLRKQKICGDTAYFVYLQVASDSGCPIAELLEDCRTLSVWPSANPAESELKRSAAPTTTWAYSDPRDLCVGDFFGLAIRIHSVTNISKTILFASRSNVNIGRFTVAEVESTVCLLAPPAAPVCVPKLNPAATYTDVYWSFSDGVVNSDQRLKSNDYAEAKSNTSFYNTQRTDQVPCCTDIAPKLQGLNKVETVRGYGIDHSCITYNDGDNKKGLLGEWKKQPVCNNNGYFNVYLKGSTECRLESLWRYCRTATINGKNFTALVPSQHAVYKDPLDTCPDDFFGLKVEIYENKQTHTDGIEPKSIIYTSPTHSGRLNLNEIEKEVCLTAGLTLATTIIPSTTTTVLLPTSSATITSSSTTASTTTTTTPPETTTTTTVLPEVETTPSKPCVQVNMACTDQDVCCDSPNYTCRAQFSDTNHCLGPAIGRPINRPGG